MYLSLHTLMQSNPKPPGGSTREGWWRLENRGVILDPKNPRGTPSPRSGGPPETSREAPGGRGLPAGYHWPRERGELRE